MLDKVRVGLRINLTKVQPENWRYRVDKDSKEQELDTHNTHLGVSNTTWIKVTDNQLTYKYPLPMFNYELSIPKTRWSDNVNHISNKEQTLATETQRQARSCNYRPGTPIGNTPDKDNYHD